MVQYEIDGDKLRKGDWLERIRMAYLVNSVAFKTALKQQGYTAKTLYDVEKLWADRRELKNQINFKRILDLVPVTGEQITSFGKRVQIKNTRSRIVNR